MNDTYVTLVGNVVADPRHAVTANGTHVASIRLGSTARRFDRGLGEWRDANTLFITISCWRSLADNVAASVSKGDPVVVRGRLRMRSYTSREGHTRMDPEIEASALGHDLSRGVARFQKATRLPAPERTAACERAAAADDDATPEAGSGEPRDQQRPGEAADQSLSGGTPPFSGGIAHSARPDREADTNPTGATDGSSGGMIRQSAAGEHAAA